MRIAAAILGLAWLLAAATAAAQSTSNLPDADKPIEIDADALEVHQEEQLAIFTGNVVVVQGRNELRADQVKVHYRQDKGSGGGDAAVNGAIRQIDAVGNVQVASPSETATGDAGVYDVDARLITLTGNVVLTRGQNVLRGRKLTMYLASGESRLESGEGGRVRGLFVPDRSSKKQ